MIGIIGGSGLTSLKSLTQTRREVVKTPFGAPSDALLFGQLENIEVVFLARHGYGHTITPHKINYQANIWAMHHIGVKEIIAIATVGGIASEARPGTIVIPDQIIDYTWGRKHTYFEADLPHVTHIDFTFPYSQALREQLINATKRCDFNTVEQGTYAATQGPRLETAAEIKKLANEGNTIVGMTGMPEAALAAELGIDYANCSMVVNWAAGIIPGTPTLANLEKNLNQGKKNISQLLKAFSEISNEAC